MKAPQSSGADPERLAVRARRPLGKALVVYKAACGIAGLVDFCLRKIRMIGLQRAAVSETLRRRICLGDPGPTETIHVIDTL